MDDIIVARALHVLAVVTWIGGVAMATTVVIPAVRRGDLGADRLKAFQAIEHRFVWQARMAVVIVGLTGLYMLWRLDLWDRFHAASFWWMHAMVCLWLLFAFVLFVAEPLILHRRFRPVGDRATHHRLCVAAAGALGTAGARPHHHPRRRRRQPRLIVLPVIAASLAVRSTAPDTSAGADHRAAPAPIRRARPCHDRAHRRDWQPAAQDPDAARR